MKQDEIIVDLVARQNLIGAVSRAFRKIKTNARRAAAYPERFEQGPQCHQIRRSSRRCFSRSQVEAAMFERTTRFGAASPVGGMNLLAPQHMSEKMSIKKPNDAGSPPP